MWQRRHGDDIIAEVTPVMGIGTWDVNVCRQPGSRELRTGGRFGLLTDAHHAADALVWAAFQHTCDSRCGVWAAIERRQSRRPKVQT